MINVDVLVPNLAIAASDILSVEARMQYDLDLYKDTGLVDVVYAAAVTDPNAAFQDTGLTAGELEAARIALEAITTLLNANNREYRKALSRIVGIRPTA